MLIEEDEQEKEQEQEQEQEEWGGGGCQKKGAAPWSLRSGARPTKASALWSTSLEIRRPRSARGARYNGGGKGDIFVPVGQSHARFVSRNLSRVRLLG